MTDYPLLAELLGLPNVHVTHYQLVGPDRINLFVESTAEAAVCPTCQHVSLDVHEVSKPQLIRDLPMWDRRCWLVYAPRRFKCATCQATFVERVSWREAGLSYTVRYEQAVYERSRREPIAQIAQDEQLSEDTVQAIFERWAKKSSSNVAIPV